MPTKPARARGPFTVTQKSFWLGTDVSGKQIVRPGFEIVIDPTKEPPMPSKRGRKQDAKQTNRRQKHELDHRASKWRCSRLAVILVDMICERGTQSAESYIAHAKAELRRANREARRK